MVKKLSDLLQALAGTGLLVNSRRDSGGFDTPPEAALNHRIVGVGALNDPIITSLVFDSREVTPGSLFFALPGTHTDGNKYIAQAVEKGAAAVVYQGDAGGFDTPALKGGHSTTGALDDPANGDAVAMVQVTDARRAMAPIADCFFDHPSRRIIVIGVTGTEGKSSTVSFIWQLLRLLGKKAGFVSTVEYSTGGDAIANPQHQTTPEAPIVQERLSQMADCGCEYAVLEASSHALSPRTSRLGCVAFDCAVFMNVTLEHLEFHGTFEQYRDDKANLFRALDAHGHTKVVCGTERQVSAVGVVNADDPSAEYFAKATHAKVLTFGTTPGGYLTASNIVSDAHGVKFNITEKAAMGGFDTPAEGGFDTILSKGAAQVAAKSLNHRMDGVTAPLPGAFNALNLMAAALAVSEMTGTPVTDIVPLCERLMPIKGRMQHINEGQPFEVIVDYAHTPSSFNMVLPPIRNRCTGHMIAVFGSGGERDRVKRPLQGEAAAAYCDTIVLTNEDPRQEDEMQILREIAEGAEREGKRENENLFLIPDRVSAIRFAFSRARPLDIVLLLGKSHENSIIGKNGPVPYDEATAARKVLREMGKCRV